MKKSKEFLDGYLTGFLGKAMRMSMDEPTEQALADVLTDFISAMAANECDAEHCAAPDEYRIEEYAAALSGRICRGEYDRWEQCGEEILDRIAAYIEECQKADFPDAPQGSEEDGSL